jgi:HEAT repeat protein
VATAFPHSGSIIRLFALGIPIMVAIALPANAQPRVADPLEQREDEELRRRLAPLVPGFRDALLGDSVDAQRATLAIIADIPPTLAATGNLNAAMVTFLQRDIKDPEVLSLAVRAFGRTFPDAADISKVIPRYVRSDIVAVRRASADALATAVENSAPVRAIESAGYFVEVNRHALPLLGVALEDKDERTQRIAMRGIQNAAQSVNRLYGSNEPLVGLVRDWLRTHLPAALFKSILQSFVELAPKLTAGFAAKEPETRIAAARTLEALGNLRKTIVTTPTADFKPAPDPFAAHWPDARRILEKQIRDPNASVRLTVTEALESLGDAIDARAVLREASTDRDAFVRWAAARALGHSAPAKPDPAVYAPDIAALKRLLADADIDVRTAAIHALSRFGTAASSAGTALLAAAGAGDIEPRVAAVDVLGALQTEADKTVPVLITALQNPDLRLRRAAAKALVRFGPDARPALPELRKALQSTDAELRIAAAEAVLAIEQKRKPKEL